MKYFLAIFMALLAYSSLSTGFVLQKKGISWIGWQGKKNKLFFKNLFIWLSGFIIMNIYGVPSAIALKTLSPHIVASFAGWGIIVLVFLSYFVLGERLYPSDFGYSGLIILGIVALNYFDKSVAITNRESINGIIFLTVIPIILFLVGLLKRFSSKFKTVNYAIVSGLSAALMVIFLKLLVLKYGYKISLYFSSLYLYLYLVFALLSLIALQIALKNGPLIAIGPLQYSANIIYPVIVVFFIFGQLVSVIQAIAITLIVISVTKILKKH